MVVIKGMETQIDCKKCPFMAIDGTDKLRDPMMCVALWATKHKVRHCVSGKILDDCPLVEIIIETKEGKCCKCLANTMGWFEGGYYTVYTGEDFFCADGER